MLENGKQKLNTEEKLTLALHRNCLILLGRLPLRQIVIKLLKWLLTEGLGVRSLAISEQRYNKPLKILVAQ